MPVATAPTEELAPIFSHLTAGRRAAGAAFPRGATFTDGRLDLCKQVVGPEWIGDLTRAVRAGGATAGLEHFLLGNNIVGDGGAAEIARMIEDPDGPGLKTLYLAGNDFTAEGAQRLTKALATNRTVEALWLKRNPLGPKGGAALGDLMARNSTIRTLDLVNTGLLDEGAEALFDGLAQNETLRCLYLDANGLGPHSAQAIARYVQRVRAQGGVGLTRLFIGINRLGDEGAERLSAALGELPQLTGLDLGANRIETAGLEALLKLAERTPSLRFLGLGFYKSASYLGELPNWFGDDGAAAIAKTLFAMRWVEAVELKDAHIGGEGLALLGDAVESCPTLFEMSAAQYAQRPPGLINRIEQRLDANLRTARGFGLSAYRKGPLRVLKHGDGIENIDSIYRNVM